MTIAFGGFTLNTETRQLSHGGRDLHLSPKAFDLLALLVEKRPAVVDKEALRDRLWPGTNVVDANLNNLASEIRAALEDDAQQPRFLRTVHRVGYAFCGEATEERAAAGSITRSSRQRGAGIQGRLWLAWKDQTFVIKDDSQTLGRDPGCQIWIDAPGVSRRHARIQLRGGTPQPTAIIEDLDSTNGTFVDGKRAKGPVTLADGQSIRIGEATLTFRAWSDAGAATKRIRRPRP